MSDIIKYIFDALFEIALIVCMTVSVFWESSVSTKSVIALGFLYVGSVIRHNKENSHE